MQLKYLHMSVNLRFCTLKQSSNRYVTLIQLHLLLLMEDIDIKLVIRYFEGMGEIVVLNGGKKICIDPQQMFKLIAQFALRHEMETNPYAAPKRPTHRSSRHDHKLFVESRAGGIVSRDTIKATTE